MASGRWITKNEMGLIRAIKHAEIRILVSTFPSCLRINLDKDTKDEPGINNRMRIRQGKEVDINNNNERKRRGNENPQETNIEMPVVQEGGCNDVSITKAQVRYLYQERGKLIR